MTDKPDVAELVEVTQADIDALHAAYTEQWGKPALAVYNADHWLAKAFARHRIATLTTLSRRNAELEAQNARHVKAMQRCIEIVKHNLYRQREKVGDVPLILRAALGGSTDV